jgi:hypothetical protein
MDEDSVTRIYCDADGFCKALEGYCKTHLLPGRKAPKWFPASQLPLSEAMAAILLFHLSGYRCYKRYYERHACAQMRGYFPWPASYSRFVGLVGRAMLPLLL